MKLRLLVAAIAAFASGAVLAQTKPAASTPAPADKTTLSYAIGYDMARDLAERKVDLDLTTLIRGIKKATPRSRRRCRARSWPLR